MGRLMSRRQWSAIMPRGSVARPSDQTVSSCVYLHTSRAISCRQIGRRWSHDPQARHILLYVGMQLAFRQLHPPR